jgi:hypothetical protein
MPVLAPGSTKNVPAHNADATPCAADTADKRCEPDVCSVSGFSWSGRMTVMVLLDFLSSAISILNLEVHRALVQLSGLILKCTVMYSTSRGS